MIHWAGDAQVALLAAPWENIASADLRIERNPQGKIIYRGPRVGVLVHCSHDIAVTVLQGASAWPKSSRRASMGERPKPKLTPDTKAISLGMSTSRKSLLSRISIRHFNLQRLSISRSFTRKVKGGVTSDVEMGIEEEDESFVRKVKRRGKNYMRIPLSTRSSSHAEYSGEALRDAEVLSALVHPGQMVVTEAVWKAVQGGLPTLAQVISLGVHEVPDLSDLLPQTLTEISPSCISQRSFSQVR
jgi:hypothetical protein